MTFSIVNMKNINVYFFGGKHPIYENILKYPPQGIKYNSNLKMEDFDKLSIYNKSYEKKKDIVVKTMTKLKLPRMIYIPQKCDVIHSARGFLPLNNKPWVVDVETVASFSFGGYNVSKTLVEKFLSSKNCKHIMPHCMASQKSVESLLNTKRFKDKLEVVYPALPVNPHKRTKSDMIRILYVTKSYSFAGKGGKELIKAFDILSKRYDDIELIMKVDMNEEQRKLVKNDRITILDKNIPRDKLFSDLYTNADIFVLPSFIDSFGYVLLEAMSSGLPIVATDIFAIPEIVEDGKTGLLVRSPISSFGKNYLNQELPRNLKTEYVSPIVNGLVEKLSSLIEDAKLRKRMGDAGRKEVESGKFSLSYRNEQLRRIYEEALKV